ncbi:MAG: hypothetical protein E7573_06125 [Ruminococcaceae bacterium]|nr:hypothetical protein [Oscillospiraceae bacterium]MBR3597266.1 AAA family ATPase [Clostridia bacterium]
MANKITIASGKGGVGKSTVTAGLGKCFASRGVKTLVVDCDAGLPCLDTLLSCSERVNFSWLDAMLERCTAKECVLTLSENIALLPAPKNAIREDFDEDSFSEVISELENEYDIILFDAPAGLGRGLLRAASASDNALIIATADEVSVLGAAALDSLLISLGISQIRLLINKYEIKAAKKTKLLTIDEIIQKTAVQLIGIVPEDKNLVYSGISPKKLKTAKSDEAFSRISRRIQGENVGLNLSQLK